MKVNAVQSVSNQMAREEFNENFGNVYSIIGQQDQMEQQAMPQMKAFAEDCEEEEKLNEKIEPKKKGGMLSGLFGGFGGSKAKAQAPNAAP